MSGDMDIMLEFTSNMARFSADMSRAADVVSSSATRMEGSMNKSLKKVSEDSKKSARDVENAFKKAAVGISTALTGALGVGFVKELYANIADAEQASSQLTAALNSTKGAAGLTKAQLDDMSASLKQLTAYDDDAVSGMQSVLLTFTKVGKEVFPQASQAVLDMSTRLGQDLKSSAVQLGKALQDPIKGIAALHRVGVDFSDAQVGMIKQLVATGHTVEAQKIILQELQTEFGGSAAAARDTMGGALQALQVRIGDTFQALGGEGGGSLRYGIELGVTAFEHLSDVITHIQDRLKSAEFASSNLAKVMAMLGKGVSDAAHVMYYGLNEALDMINTTIGGIDSLVGAFNRLIKTTNAFGGLSEKGPLTGWLAKLQEQTKAGAQSIKDVMSGKTKNKTDYLGLWDVLGDTDSRLAKLHEQSRKAGTGPKIIDTDGLSEGPTKEEIKAAKKREQLIKSEEKSLAGIVQQYKLKVAQLQQEVSGHKQDNDLLAKQEAIARLINLPAAERQKALKQINALHQQELQLLHQKAVAGERDKLQNVLDDLKKQNEELQGKNEKQAELKPLIEAEAKLRDLVKVGLGENLDLQKQIRDEAQKQVEILKEQKHQEALKNLKEITDEYEKQNAKLQAQLTGEEDLLPLLEQEKKIREDMHLTDQEKADGIRYIEEQYQRQKDLTQAIEDQKQTLDDIKGSTLNYKDKLASLSGALQSGRINTKQWADTVRDLYQEQLKAKTGADNFAHSLVSGLSQAITSGKNFKEVLKDMAKQLALFAAQKLLLDPLENAIANIGNKLMGTGKYTPNPLGGTGVYGGGAGYGGPMALGGGGSSNGIFGAGGQALGAPGVLSTSGGGGGGLLSGIADAFSGFGWGNNYGKQLAAANGITGAGASLMGGMGALSAGFGGLTGAALGSVANLLGLPKFADGGVSRGGMALVGEDGPELAYLPRGTQIFPNGGSNFSINKTYDGFSGDLAQVMDQVARAEARNWLNDPANADKKESLYGLKMAENANGMNNRSGLGALDVYNAGGRVGWAAGDQHRAMLQKAIALGVAVPDRLMQYAGFEDDRWSSTGMSAGMFSALGYNSMGMGGGTYGGNSSATAYAAGRNEGFDYSQWGRKVGQNYIGPSAEYLQNIKGWGEFAENYPGGMGSFNQKSGWYEGPDGAFRRRYIGPGANSTMAPFDPALNGPGGSTGGITYGDGYIASAGSGGGKFRPDGKGGYSWSKNFDPLNPASGYTPELGTLDAFKASGGKGYKPADGPMYIDPTKDPSTFSDAERRYLADDAAAADRLGERIELDYLNKKLGYKNTKSPSLTRRDLWHYQQPLQIEQLPSSAGSWGDLSPAMGTVYGAPGTLSVSNTRNDIFEGNYSAPVSASWAQKGVAPFYKPSTDAFTAGQIAAQMMGGRAIKGYATGGRPSTTEPSWVGENGRELFWPDSSGTIIPSEKSKQLLGSQPPVINFINKSGVIMAEPRVEKQADGTWAAILERATAANAAKGGSVTQGVRQAGKVVAR